MSRDISIKCMYWLTTACSVSMLHSGCREYKKKKKIDGYSNLKKKSAIRRWDQCIQNKQNNYIITS